MAVAIFFSGITLANAQQKMTPDQRLQKRLDRMKTQLNLTDGQVAQITPILMNAQQKMMDLHNSGADREAMKTQRRAIASDSNNQIIALLNPDQQQKYKAMKEEMKEKRMQKAGAAGPGE